MPFYQKIDTAFIEIPANAGTSINYSLIQKEFGLQANSVIEFRKILFNSDFTRKKNYKLMPWWMLVGLYPQSINSKKIFSVVRNPFDRMVVIFFNFTKFKYEYAKYRPNKNDTKLGLQNKFEAFIREYHMWRNMVAGAGLNIIEILSRRSKHITSDMYAEKSHSINNYYYYDQAYFLNKDFQKNKSIFSQDINKSCDIIKYEHMDILCDKYPDIFSEKFIYEDFESKKESSAINLEKMPFINYYNKYSKKFVQEHFEIDFYNFHYKLDFKLNEY